MFPIPLHTSTYSPTAQYSALTHEFDCSDLWQPGERTQKAAQIQFSTYSES